jgi:hypothetical protein
MVGRDARPHETVRSEQSVEEIHLDTALSQQVLGGVVAGRARPHDGDAQRLVGRRRTRGHA